MKGIEQSVTTIQQRLTYDGGIVDEDLVNRSIKVRLNRRLQETYINRMRILQHLLGSTSELVTRSQDREPVFANARLAFPFEWQLQPRRVCDKVRSPKRDSIQCM